MSLFENRRWNRASTGGESHGPLPSDEPAVRCYEGKSYVEMDRTHDSVNVQ